jgi:hypothetical protein
VLCKISTGQSGSQSTDAVSIGDRIQPHFHVDKPDTGQDPAQSLLSGLCYCGIRLRTWKTQAVCGFRRFRMELLVDLMHRNSFLGVSPSEPAGEELASVGTDRSNMLEHSFNMGDVLTTGCTVLQTTASNNQQSEIPSRPWATHLVDTSQSGCHRVES